MSTRRKSLKKKRMATLYVHSEFAGDWPKCAELAGLEEVPKLTDPEMRKYIADEGGKVPGSGEPVKDSTPLTVESNDDESIAEALKSLNFPLPNDPNEQEKWNEIARLVGPIWLSIARGETKPSQGQRMVLKDIMERAYGKVGTKKADEEEIQERNVVFLPLAGEQGRARIDKPQFARCPNCGADMQFMREEDDL